LHAEIFFEAAKYVFFGVGACKITEWQSRFADYRMAAEQNGLRVASIL
jgi:hypothetical protein